MFTDFRDSKKLKKSKKKKVQLTQISSNNLANHSERRRSSGKLRLAAKMVRRRGIVGGLANQLSCGACRNWMTPASTTAWQWQQQLRAQPASTSSPLMATMHSLCNRMVGAIPRMPIIPQPEVSSRRLSRLRRNLMKLAPELVHVPCSGVLPMYPATRPLLQPAPPQSLLQSAPPPPLLPAWCRTGEQPQFNGELPTQLKQQLQQLKCEQDWEREQQFKQQPYRELKSSFRPFNFGKCASNVINFVAGDDNYSESALYAATHPKHVPTINVGWQQPRAPQERHVHAADFGYVQLAKRMAATPTPSDAIINRTKMLPVHVQKKELPKKAPVSFQTQAGVAQPQAEGRQGPQGQQTAVPAAKELNGLAAGIDSKLQKICNILFTELGENSLDSAEQLKSLASLQHLARSGQLQLRPPVQRQKISEQQTCTHEKLNDPATRQQSSMGEMLKLPHPERKKQKSNSEMSSDMAAPQPTAKSSKMKRPTKCNSPATSPQSEISQKLETGVEQELQMSSGQLELLQKILHKSQPKPSETNMAANPKVGTANKQLNLTQLLQANKLKGDEAGGPLWNSLMQLVAHICENKPQSSEDSKRLSAGRSKEQEQKQYAVYLMVGSDEEDEPRNSGRLERQSRKPQLEQQVQLKQLEPQLEQARSSRKKKRVSFSPVEDATYWLPPPRRPLHWPKHQPPTNPVKPKKLKLPRRSGSRSPSRKRGRCLAGGAVDRNWNLLERDNTYSLKKGHDRMVNPFLKMPATDNRYGYLCR